MCEAPPAMKSCTTRFARGLWCSPPSARSVCALATMVASAMPPSPPPECQRNSRRVMLRAADTAALPGSIHKHELIQIQYHAAGVRHAVLFCVGRECVAFRRGRIAAEGEADGGADTFGVVAPNRFDSLREVLRHRHS